MQIRIVMHYDVPDSDQDPEDNTGLTSEAFDQIHGDLQAMGMDDITITTVTKD
jgi:hypothetical protein